MKSDLLYNVFVIPINISPIYNIRVMCNKNLVQIIFKKKYIKNYKSSKCSSS